ncbi:methyltransferase domain-containing protein [Candidatus Bathyarchaeota archaeon]|nr:methyltransferase domain-containing protein [Candidatus Bathyarchaeota archaeon]MBT4320884.1 methyltransferase domain-containing protein [Candidatus Bathyarchaeota archaeon]MBT6605980.1 methyltransferase domain-containing protein [Candidatus Bathyarchaeota archaeon]MBT7187219.1 methyltransferase domain-containing protein [Candidatus Bathyarchaeota archaeon]
MPDRVRERVLETYRLTADTYDRGVSERLGSSRWGIESLTGMLLGEMRVPENPVALDIACGTGLSTFSLIDYIVKGDVHGVDLSPEMVRKAVENADELDFNIEFKEGDVENLPYPDGLFNMAISNMSFQFFPDKLRALKEIHRVMTPGGRMGHLFGGGKHVEELISICLDVSKGDPDLIGLREAVEDVVRLHIDLEAVQRLLWEAGFRKPFVYGYHRVMNVKPEDFWFGNPYPAYWTSSVPAENRAELDSRILSEMKERSGPRGFKITWYTIQAYGSKPTD